MSENAKMSPIPSMSSFAGLGELWKKLAFIFIALVVYRLGTFIPIPGVNPQVIKELFEQNSSGVLGLFNAFSGGAIERMTIFSLSVVPYISASIIFQLISMSVPQIAELKKEGTRGKEKINSYVRYATVFIALIQSFGIAVGLEQLVSPEGYPAVVDKGIFFITMTMMTLTAGTMFLLWLGEKITAQGLGNGISLIIFVGIITQIPQAIYSLYTLGRSGSISIYMITFVIAFSLFLVSIVVLVERSFRPVPVFYPKQQRGAKMSQEHTSYLPLRINSAGVIPPIFAISLLLMPITIIQFYITPDSPEWLINISTLLRRGGYLYVILYALGITFFAYFYTAVTFDPKEVAENLRKQGGYIHGIRPGEQTAAYLDYILTRITLIGALYLIFVCVFPEILVGNFAVPIDLGGTSLLIVVSVVIETLSQIQGYLYMYQYRKFLKKSKVLGAKR